MFFRVDDTIDDVQYDKPTITGAYHPDFGAVVGDPLLGVVLQYEGLLLAGERGPGQWSFTDGTVTAYASEALDEVLFTADVVDVVADLDDQWFWGYVTDVVPIGLDPADSRILSGLIAQGASEVTFDPAIIEASGLFAKSALVQDLYVQQIYTAIPELSGDIASVPEPTITVALGVSTLLVLAATRRSTKYLSE